MDGGTRSDVTREGAREPSRPLRLLIVMPSWVGDAVMATPALRLIRESLRGSFIGGLVRPGIDQVLAGTDFFDQLHVERARGVMGPKLVASKVRPVRYDTALLLTNSFSTALITRLAFIPRRIGYDRDGRGLLLTDRIKPLKREGRGGGGGKRGFAVVPAVDYYLAAAWAMLGIEERGASGGVEEGRGPVRLELGTTADEERGADEILARAAGALRPGAPIAIINPGANDAAKRWPAERFGAVAAHCIVHRGMNVLVNGSPAEREVVDAVVRAALSGVAAASGGGAGSTGSGGVSGGSGVGGAGEVGKVGGATIASLPELGVTIGSLKALVKRSALMVTNDTGPRHFAAAYGVPCVTLYGPTDPRWTTLPRTDGAPPAADVVADPTLPEDEVADDHPDRCRIDRIGVDEVIAAVERVLGTGRGPTR